MTTEEYIQLRAFARVDGTYVGILWIASFACYLGGLSSPMLGLIAGIIAILSPFFAVKRLTKFRDDIRDGEISGRRSMIYYALILFLPFARLAFNTFLPALVFILFIKPCSFCVCLFFG